LADDDVVLVVAGDGEHEIGRALDARALENEQLGRVASLNRVLELLLEHGEAVRPLLDQRDLPASADQQPREVRADLASAADDHVHQSLTSSTTWGSSHERTASVSTSIAVEVGQTVRRPRSS